MEEIRTEALQQFEELLIENDKKSEFLLIFEAAFVRMRNELEKEKREKDIIKFQSDNLSNRFEEKLLEVQEDILEFELFSDIGISALVEGIQWFRKSIETYEQKKRSLSRVERVQIDASRLLSTVHNRIRANIQLCSFGGDEYDKFQKLTKSLEDSIHIMNSKMSICFQNVVKIDYVEITENMNEVGNLADDLLIFLKNIQEKQRKTIDEKLKLDTNEEKCKYAVILELIQFILKYSREIVQKTKSENAKEVEKEVGKSVEKFVKLNRNKSSLTMEDVRKIIVEVNGSWKRSYDQEVETHRDELKNMFVEFERQLKEWNIQKSSEKEENFKINEWKGSDDDDICSFSSDGTCDHQMDNDNDEYTGIIRQTVFDITELDENGEISESVMIGGLKWKICVCVQSDEELKIHLYCENKDNEDEISSEWQCTAKYNLRIMDEFETKQLYFESFMAHFRKGKRTTNCEIELKELFGSIGDHKRDDSIHIEVEVVVLAISGFPRLVFSFTNSNYQQLFGTINFTFPNISVLDEEPVNSSTFNIGGFSGKIHIATCCGNLRIYFTCVRDDVAEWSCEANAEIRLLKRSKSDEFYSEYGSKRLNNDDNTLTIFHFIGLDDLMNVENDYIENDSITIQANITIFKPI